MIKGADRIVKDFRTGETVKRESLTERFRNCAGCGLLTRIHDHLYGWNVCRDCDSDEIAERIADLVMNPNRGIQ